MLQNSHHGIWFDGKLVPWDQAQVHVLPTVCTPAFGGIFEAFALTPAPTVLPPSSVYRSISKRLVNSAKILVR